MREKPEDTTGVEKVSEASVDGASPERVVLVTGAAGFIGSHLCEFLIDDGWAVWGLDNFHPHYSRSAKKRNLRRSSAHPRMHLVEGDVRDGVLLDGLMGGRSFVAVVHLAGLPGVRTSFEAPAQCMEINVGGTLTLLEAMARHEVGSLVFASSSSVYGDSTVRPSREVDPAGHPISPYGASKRAGEMLCHAYSRTYGISVHCLRIFNVFGPRQRPDLAIHKFARLMRSGIPVPIYGDGSSERDYTYVGDVVDGIHRSLRSLVESPRRSAEYELINLGSGDPVRLERLIEVLSSALGVEPLIDRFPDQPGDVLATRASVDRAAELLGWRPRASLEEGVRAFVSWLDQVVEAEAGRPESVVTADRSFGGNRTAPLHDPAQTGS